MVSFSKDTTAYYFDLKNNFIVIFIEKIAF